MTTTPTKRGFAGLSPERRREIARKGGSSVPSDKRSFSKDRSLARSAGSKGGSHSSDTQTVYLSYTNASAAALRRGLTAADIVDLGDAGWMVPLNNDA